MACMGRRETERGRAGAWRGGGRGAGAGAARAARLTSGSAAAAAAVAGLPLPSDSFTSEDLRSARSRSVKAFSGIFSSCSPSSLKASISSVAPRSSPPPLPSCGIFLPPLPPEPRSNFPGEYCSPPPGSSPSQFFFFSSPSIFFFFFLPLQKNH